MGIDVLLVARADPMPSYATRDGDRRVAFGRPHIPAAWLALFDPNEVVLSGAKPRFVALVTQREAGLDRLRVRRGALLRGFGVAFEPYLAAFERAVAQVPEEYLQIIVDELNWPAARSLGFAKSFIRSVRAEDDKGWRSFFGSFDGENVLEKPSYVVGALRGYLDEELGRDPYPPELLEAIERLRQRVFTSPDVAFREEFRGAVEAMRFGVLRAALFSAELTSSHDPTSNRDDDLLLFARATTPLGADEGPAPSADPPDWKRSAHYLGSLDRAAETRLLTQPAIYARNYYLADLAPVLFRALRGALVAGTAAVPAVHYASELLGLLAYLGGDAETGVLTVVGGRELDDDGAFGRALALIHAYGVWAVATLEHADGPLSGIACAAPLLVLARLRLRLRDAWHDGVDFDWARTRFPAWTIHTSELLVETSRRAGALADFVTACEASKPRVKAQASAIAPILALGTPVLQPKRGVTVIMSTHASKVTVASFAHPEKPYPEVLASFLKPLELPADVGRMFLGVPRAP